eukprot:jgi/Botrbrau1/13468/Bobra.0082s0068.1
MLDITEGGALPDDSELFLARRVRVRAPALLGAGQPTPVTWMLENVSGCPRVSIFLANGLEVFSTRCCNSNPAFRLGFKDVGQVIPYLELMLLFWNEFKERHVRVAPEDRVCWCAYAVGPWKPMPMGVSWINDLEIPKDAQRALSVLQMWAWGARRRGPRFAWWRQAIWDID